jgi:hypothetical protein
MENTECKLENFNSCPGASVLPIIIKHGLTIENLPRECEEGKGYVWTWDNDDATLVLSVDAEGSPIRTYDGLEKELEAVYGLLELATKYRPDEFDRIDHNGKSYFRLWWD